MLANLYAFLLMVATCESSLMEPPLPPRFPGNSIKSFSVDVKSIVTSRVASSHEMHDLIATDRSLSLSRCLLSCHYTGSCMSVNFNPTDGECKMYNVTQPRLALVMGIQDQFAKRSALRLLYPFDSCDGNDCAVGNRCVPMKMFEFSCVNQPRTL